MSTSFKEKQDAIIADFQAFDDWMDKYEMIIDLGKEIQGISVEKRKDDQLIDGCQSRVWLKAKIFYYKRIRFPSWFYFTRCTDVY